MTWDVSTEVGHGVIYPWGTRRQDPEEPVDAGRGLKDGGKSRPLPSLGRGGVYRGLPSAEGRHAAPQCGGAVSFRGAGGGRGSFAVTA